MKAISRLTVTTLFLIFVITALSLKAKAESRGGFNLGHLGGGQQNNNNNSNSGGSSFGNNTWFKNVARNDGGHHGPVFPSYPSSPRKQIGGLRVPSHPDSFGNHVTEDHLSRVDFARTRSEDFMKHDSRFTGVVSVGRAHFSNVYRPEFVSHTAVFNTYASRYNTIVVGHPIFIDTWHRHYFYGGFYWGFHPCLDIDAYFYNPMVYWFYVGNYDPYYYRTWYSVDYDAYPEMHHPFEYHGVYYPTENLRQLLFGVSAMPVEKQAHFREAMEVFTRRIAQKMANGLDTHVRLGSGDVVVTHYEVIGYDDAVVTEGFVSFQGKSYNFRGLIDIHEPGQSEVFVPATWDMNPTKEQLATLDGLNEKIASIKGEPLAAEASPDAPTEQVTAPGVVTAEPDSH